MKRTPISLVLASMLATVLICVALTGCSSTSAGPSPAPVQNAQTSQGSEDTPSGDAEQAREYYFEEDGIRKIRLYSEDITASYEYYWADIDKKPRFENLVSLDQDIPQDKQGKKVPDLVLTERDWQNFEHRLAEVNYDLKVRSGLEEDIDKIVYRLLALDGVIPMDSEISYLGEITWINTGIFDCFIEENVSVEIINDDGDQPSGLSWQVYSGGCFPGSGKNVNETVCGEHLFNVWLVDLSGSEITVWDMKHVDEPGCGELLPMYRDS